MKKKYKTPQVNVCDMKDEVSILAGSTETVTKGASYDPDDDPPPYSTGYSWMLLPLVVLSMSSCSSSDDASPSQQSDMVKMTFRASQEDVSMPTTKAAFAPHGDDRKVVWQTGDMVNVMYSSGAGKFSRPFALSSGVGSGVGFFTGEAHLSADNFTVLSPFQGQAVYGENGSDAVVNNVVLPTVQTATSGSFDPHAGIMMGLTENSWSNSTTPIEFSFRSVCSFIEVTPAFDCSAIIVSTRTPDEYLAGNIRVNNGNIPTVDTEAFSHTNTGANKVTLRGRITAGNTYYIAVLPGTLTGGIRVTCVGSDGKMATKRTAGSVTLERGQYHDFSNFLASPYTAAVDGIDLGTGDGVLWASCNVGATAPHEYGDKFAWGDAMPLYSYDASNIHLNSLLTPSQLLLSYKAADTWGNYKWGDGVDTATPSSITFSKYDATSAALETADDAASQYAGDAWRTPSATEISNLINNCDWAYVENFNGTGVAGYTVTNKSDATKQIFLPITTTGSYWTNQLGDSNKNQAKMLVLTSSQHSLKEDWRIRSSFVRPVRK